MDPCPWVLGRYSGEEFISAYQQATQICEDSSRRDSAQGDPIIAAPTEHASYRMQRKDAKEAIEGARFGSLELNRIAARTFAPDPKKLREPIRPVPAYLSQLPSPFAPLYLAALVIGFELEFESSQARRQRILPVAKAILESAAP
jgi:hypothetical protein